VLFELIFVTQISRYFTLAKTMATAKWWHAQQVLNEAVN